MLGVGDYVAYFGFLVGEKQPSERNNPHKMSEIVNYIAGVDGLLVKTGFTDDFKSLTDIYPAVKFHHLNCHDASG